jgi:hypothetical protein
LPEEAIGDPLAAALGLATGDAERILREIATTGTARHRLTEIWNRRTGRRMWVLLGGSAPSAAAGFIGADIMVSRSRSPPVEGLDHQHNLEYGEMVPVACPVAAGPSSPEESALIVFRSAHAGVYVLIVRWAAAVGASFEGSG